MFLTVFKPINEVRVTQIILHVHQQLYDLIISERDKALIVSCLE